jgi:hypothetical protein
MPMTPVISAIILELARPSSRRCTNLVVFRPEMELYHATGAKERLEIV